VILWKEWDFKLPQAFCNCWKAPVERPWLSLKPLNTKMDILKEHDPPWQWCISHCCEASVGVMACCIRVYLGDPKALPFSTVKNKQTLKWHVLIIIQIHHNTMAISGWLFIDSFYLFVMFCHINLCNHHSGCFPELIFSWNSSYFQVSLDLLIIQFLKYLISYEFLAIFITG